MNSPNTNETTYAKIVRLKKKFIKKEIIPSSIGRYIDGFFNSVHNLRIQSKDAMRDVAVVSKDTLRDNIIRIKDITRDNVVRTKDIARDNVIRTRDTTRDLLIKTKDIARDNVVRTKDISQGFISGFISKNKDLVSPRFLYNLIKHIGVSLKNIRHAINEKSDQQAVHFIDHIVVNSQNVQHRVKKYYDRESVVIHPPVELSINSPRLSNEDIQIRNLVQNGFWLSVNRLTPEKRIDIQIEAFKNNKLIRETLLIVGGYDSNSNRLVSTLLKSTPKNVHILGSIHHETLTYLYSKCKGLITTSLDEDFGMNVIEAMSYGKPVIAPDEGGYKETIVHKQTGILIDNLNAESLANSINTVKSNLSKNPSFYTKKSLERARLFEAKEFALKIKNEINNNLCGIGGKKLVFIVGVPMSGTERLCDLLCKHLDTVSENGENNMLYEYDIPTIKKTIRNKDARVIIEKTPLHILKLETIQKEFPKAKIIHVVRDLVSVYASYTFTEYKGWEYTGITVQDWVKLYKKMFYTFYPKITDPGILTLSYEDVIEKPLETLHKACEFIGISKDYIHNINDKTSSERLKEKVSPEDIKYIETNLLGEIDLMNKLINRQSNLD